MSHAPQKVAFASVSYNQSSGTAVLSKAFNATITDDGLAQVTVNFVEAATSAKYVMAGTFRWTGVGSGTIDTAQCLTILRPGSTAARTASTCKLQTSEYNGPGSNAYIDGAEVSAAFYGNK